MLAFNPFPTTADRVIEGMSRLDVILDVLEILVYQLLANGTFFDNVCFPNDAVHAHGGWIDGWIKQIGDDLRSVGVQVVVVVPAHDREGIVRYPDLTTVSRARARIRSGMSFSRGPDILVKLGLGVGEARVLTTLFAWRFCSVLTELAD